MKFPAWLTVSICASILMARPSFGAPLHSTNWPLLSGRIGPYSGLGNAEDIQEMARNGFNLTLLGSVNPKMIAAFESTDSKYIDFVIWSYITRRCQPQLEAAKAAKRKGTCLLSSEDQRAILDDVAKHLSEVQSSPVIAGFWILDDYPGGDISKLLAAIHDRVKKANAAGGLKRPTICGLGGSLDAKKSREDLAFAQDRRYMKTALTNISPSACDVVAPYPYGVTSVDDPALIDWSMHDLIPSLLQELRARGFRSSPFLLPVIDAFSYREKGSKSFWVLPRPSDIEQQMKAYCDAGAVAMLFFTWRAKQADQAYANTPSIRDGIKRGMADCVKH